MAETKEIYERIEKKGFSVFDLIGKTKYAIKTTRVLLVICGAMFLMLFLPWTQNITSTGEVTTLLPGQRPQAINSVIAGKIEKWYVREGNFVNKGDTIVHISEIKDDYFDPNLLSRTKQQIDAKQSSVVSYQEKVKALENQIIALERTRDLKIQQTLNYIEQAKLKIESDSLDFLAAETNLDIAQKQFERMQKLYDDGLKSLTELEGKRSKLQEAQAKKIGSLNKLMTSRNNLINYKVELVSVQNQYQDKLSKAQSDKYSALSTMYDTEATVSKMENQFQNYSIRTGMHYVTAPQSGLVTKALKIGIGGTFKEGEEIVTIMPSDHELAVFMYVKPMDLPLIQIGEKVRFLFDGWPSVAFSGWPNLSYGTFGGEIVAIDNFISPNGKYRILVAQDPSEPKWPDQLRVGSGANGIALLNNVPIWYELWRQINGFPPDYYNVYSEYKDDKKKEK